MAAELAGFNDEHEEALVMDVLLTGGDTELGRTIAEVSATRDTAW
jgi:hypothetical protein